MDEREIYNPDGSEHGLPLNIPPADAWSDMRRRLDDEIPVSGMLLPDNVIYVGNGFMRSIASLFILLCITSIVTWVGGLNVKQGSTNGSNSVASSITKRLDTSNLKRNSANKIVVQSSDSAQKEKQPSPLNINILSVQKGKVKKDAAGRNTGVKNFVVTDGYTVGGSKQDTIANAADNLIKGSNLTQNPIVTKLAKNVTTEKKDTAVHEDDAKVKDDEDDIKVQAGLQWNSQVPFAGAENYFIGPNGSSQLYRVLLPGAWLSAQVDKYLFMAEVNPFASTLFNPKPFVTTTNQVNGQTTQTETRNLAKLFGASVAIRTDYNITGNWWAGAGIQANFWHQGVSNNYYSQTGGGNTTQFKTTTGLSDSDWVYFFKMQVRGDAELMYKTPYWHAGIRTGLFLMPVAQNYGGPNNPLQTEFFFRLVLFNRKQHKVTK